MFLHRLSEYADRLGLPPPMYQEKPVRYVIQLDEAGRYLHLVDCASQEHKQGIRLCVPDCKRSVNIRPFLLADNVEYVLGQTQAERKAERVQKQHRAFVDLAARCAQETDETSVHAVVRFLEAVDGVSFELPDDFDSNARITFEVNGKRPVDLAAVRDYWAKVAAVSDGNQVLQCLVCGEMRPSVERLPIAIRGIPGGQSTGMVLISANEAAFESYGLTASLIAPTCEDCGQRFGNALNELLRNKETHINTPSLSFLFWAREEVPFSLTSILSETKPDEVRLLFQAPWKGRPEIASLETSPFYAAVLSARGPRVVVRDWMETTLGAVQRHLMRYFALQRIIDSVGKERWFPLWQLIGAVVRKGGKEEPPPQVGQRLLHAALHGGSLPESLLYLVLRRIRAEQEIQPAHAALIKMVLLTQPDTSWLGPTVSSDSSDSQERILNSMAELDLTSCDPAYLCGRLLAELEEIQTTALGRDLSSTVTDRYFGTASSAPASVFGRLLRGAQPHLAKLRSDPARQGAAYRLETHLQEIVAGFTQKQFPSTLNQLEQGRFALGYYHQRTFDRRAAIAASAAKKALQGQGVGQP